MNAWCPLQWFYSPYRFADLDSLVSAQREEHMQLIEAQKQSEEKVKELQEQNKFLTEGYEGVKEEMRKRAEMVRGKVLREELRKELEDKRRIRQAMREKQCLPMNDGAVNQESEHKEEAVPGSEAEYRAMQRIEAMRKEFEREVAAKLDLERSKWQETWRLHQESAQLKEAEVEQQRRANKRKLEELEAHTMQLRSDNYAKSLEVEKKEEEMQSLRIDVVTLQGTIEQLQEEMTREMNEWDQMKACLEKEIHRAYKELKVKEAQEARLTAELQSMREDIKQAISKKQEKECEHCGAAKRRKVSVSEEETIQQAKQSQPREESSVPARSSATPLTPSRLRAARPARCENKDSASSIRKRTRSSGITEKTLPSKRSSRGMSHVGTPRPTATTTKKNTTAMLASAARESSALGSSSSAIDSSNSSPVRRASVATTPRSRCSSLGPGAQLTPTPTQRRKERPSASFVSKTPRFDTKLDPLRYEKLSGSRQTSGRPGS